MFSSTKIFIFVVSLFFIIASVKSKDYELELQKYLITNFDNDGQTKLQQNLQEGKDNLTFPKGVTRDGDGDAAVNYFIQTKAGNFWSLRAEICAIQKQPNNKNFDYLVNDIISAAILQGRKCPLKKNVTFELENSFKVTSKALQDIEGIIQLSMFFEFPPYYEATLRYDVIGTIKAK